MFIFRYGSYTYLELVAECYGLRLSLVGEEAFQIVDVHVRIVVAHIVPVVVRESRIDRHERVVHLVGEVVVALLVEMARL